MPLPTDQDLLNLSDKILATFTQIFGEHPGIRPAHGKGTLLRGAFTPTAAAADLSIAQHFQQALTPVLVRFFGLDRAAGHSGHRSEHSAQGDRGPLRPGRARAHRRHRSFNRWLPDPHRRRIPGVPGRAGNQRPGQPGGLAAGGLPRFTPSGVTFRADPQALSGQLRAGIVFRRERVQVHQRRRRAGRFGRYRIIPEAGTAYLEDSEVQSKDDNYLFTEIAERIAAEPVRFTLAVQLADDGDVVDDATIHWPLDREVRELGTVELTTPVDRRRRAAEARHLRPHPPAGGNRALPKTPCWSCAPRVYLISGRKRRAA